jgi:hypothetical protein
VNARRPKKASQGRPVFSGSPMPVHPPRNGPFPLFSPDGFGVRPETFPTVKDRPAFIGLKKT